MSDMKKLVSTLRSLHEDKSGAAFIEYTVLLGVILAVTIGVVVAVGDWASDQWTDLNSQLDAAS
jgi:Flp pilus assembly pilin Flp